ncbi:MAG: hypothetical protein EA349_07150 [Halomonadaceae bacterium]|nr:MAG: hypothetical protein EA349_07150 [Halomonadaceae bacterium]
MPDPYAENPLPEKKRRSGEQHSYRFRSNRFFCVGHQWFFTTREGFHGGPYISRQRAETGLSRFLSVVGMLPKGSHH